MLVRVSTYRYNVKRLVGWVAISDHYNFPLLHYEEEPVEIPFKLKYYQSDKL